MNRLKKFRVFKNPILFGLIVFVVILTLTQFLTFQRYLLLKNTEQQEIISQANWVDKEFQKILNQSFSTTQTLAFIVENYGIPNNFDSIAKLLLQTNKNINALELVDSTGVITHVYPLEGNDILGFNILKDSIGKKGAILTIKRKDYFIAGPIHLKQGGDGFVSRTPIFKENTFKGFTAAVIKLPDVLSAINIDTAGANRFSYQLTKINTDKSEEIFFSSNTSSVKDEYSITIAMSNGEWKLYIISNNKDPFSSVALFAVLGLILSLLGGIFAWYLLRQPFRLDQMVKEKTSLLFDSEEKYRILVEQASDGIFLLDEKANFLDVNIQFCSMFDEPKEYFLGKNVRSIIERENIKNMPLKFEQLAKGETVRTLRRLVRKDGTIFSADASVKMMPNNLYQGIIHDVTEREKATALIRESELKYRELIQRITDAYLAFDTNWNLTYVNEKAIEFIGQGEGSLIGKNIKEVFPEVEKNEGYKLLLNTMVTQENDSYLTFYEPFSKWVENQVYPSPEGVSVFFRDVTEREEAGELIKKSELKYRELTMRFTDAFVAYDKDWNLAYINPLAEQLFGQDPESAMGKNILELLPGVENNEAYVALKNSMVTQQYTYYVTFYEPFGKWFENHVYPAPEGVSIYFRDVTEKMIAENKMADLKAKMESAIRIGKIGYWNWDVKTDVLEWSDRMYTIFDVDPGTPLNYEYALNRVHPDDIQRINEEIIFQIENNKASSSYTYRVIHKDKSMHHVMVEIEAIYNKKGLAIKLHGTVIDITERVNAQQELKDSQEKFYKSFHSNLIGKVIMDEQRVILEANDAIAKTFETTRENLIGKKLIDADVLDFSSGEQTKKRKQLWDKLIEQRFLMDEEFTYTLKSGKIIPALLSIEQFKIDNKTTFLVSAFDNTKRKEAEEALLKSEERFRKLTSNAPVGIFQTDPSGMCTYVNEQLLLYSGMGFDDTMGLGWTNAIYKEDKEEVMREWKKAMAQEKPHKATFRFQHKNKKIITLSVRATPLFGINKEVIGYIGMASDITSLIEVEKRLESQNVELLKTNAELDRFVYSASHELRAPLASVLGLVDIILSEEKETDLVFKVEMIQKSVMRLDSFIKDIVQYSQNKHLEIVSEKIDFRTIINDSLESLWFLENRSQIDIKINIVEQIDFYSDKKRISIILNNLISNAIKYHNVTGSNPMIHIVIRTSEDLAHIEVSDNGVGIPKEHLSKIFKMFYRVSSKVMGTGLFVVKEIIEKINGEIKVTSEENKGTKFIITIPNKL